MSDQTQFTNLLDRLLKKEHVLTAFVSSRAGAFTLGETPRLTDRGIYSAITSLMIGASEQLANEMNDELDFVQLNMSNSKLIVIGAGPKHLLGILVEPASDIKSFVVDVKAIIKESLA